MIPIVFHLECRRLKPTFVFLNQCYKLPVFEDRTQNQQIPYNALYSLIQIKLQVIR